MEKSKRKGRWCRRMLRVFVVLILLIVVGCFIADRYVQFRKSDKELKKFFADNGIKGTIGYYSTHGLMNVEC